MRPKGPKCPTIPLPLYVYCTENPLQKRKPRRSVFSQSRHKQFDIRPSHRVKATRGISGDRRAIRGRIVQRQNEKIAEICTAHADRFVGLGAVALQHPDLAAEQMDHAVKKLNMRGFQIDSSVNGELLSAPKFDIFWAKAEELGILILIHPGGAVGAAPRFPGNGFLDNVIGHPLETTLALSHLIFEGTLDRYPGVKICGAHGGGFLASYMGRSNHCAEFSEACKPVQKKPPVNTSNNNCIAIRLYLRQKVCATS